MELNNITESWIHEQIKRRQKDVLSICVRIMIKEEAVDMILESSGCPKYSGPARKANPKELKIFNLWDSLHLNKSPINSGSLIAFLKQMSN